MPSGRTLATVLIACDEGADAGWVERLGERAGTGVEVVRGGGELVGLAADPLAGDIVVVLAPGSAAQNWVAELVGLSGPAVGTVSCLPAAEAPDELDPALAAAPTIEAPVGAAILLARPALELLGGVEDGDAAAAIREFSERCGDLGLVNLLAAGVPYATPAAQVEAEGPVAEAQARLRQRTQGISVTIDGRSLNVARAGTQVHALELIAALHDRVRLRVVLPPDPSEEAQELLGGLAGVELRSYDEVNADPQPTDVVHRPYQVFDMHDLALLRKLGSRLVVTHQDQILYRAPGYFGTREEWLNYRRGSRLLLTWADRVLFFTEHARDEAFRDRIVDPEQAVVVPIGASRERTRGTAERSRPAGDWDRLGGVPFLLVLGTDFAHKNRPFAIELVRELRRRHDWPGGLVLAGLHYKDGSSQERENELMGVGDAPPVLRLDGVSESERLWLLEHCAGVAMPTLAEGFGLVPFEAGEAGKPCFFAPLGPFAETLPGVEALLVPWDAAASADRVHELLADEVRTAGHVDALRAAAARLTWSATADQLVGLYEEVLAAPPRPIVRYTEDAAEREELMLQVHDNWRDVVDWFGDDGFLLLGREGTIPVAMRRPLLAATARPWARRPLFALLRAFYRLGGGGRG